MNSGRRSEAGFTLIETLVALTVLAVGAMTLLTAVERHARSSGMLADRIMARWVAENGLAATSLGLEIAPRWQKALAIDWSVQIDARALPGTGLNAVTARVSEVGSASEAAVVTLTGYAALTGDGK